jgi:two-component system, response regulator
LRSFWYEDSAEDAEMTLRALRKNHLANRVHWVKDDAEALEYLFRRAERAPAETPKLVMLNLKMPKVGGIEVLRQLKANPETRAIPMLVMTSSNEERDVAEAYPTVSKIGLYWVLSNRTPQ